MKLLVPDLISPSYFPAIAAVELGCFADRGVDIDLELHFPVTSAVATLELGEAEFVAGSAHALFHGSPKPAARLIAALSQKTYWFLVIRSDIEVVENSPLQALSGLHIGAAPGPADVLIQMLSDVGVEDVDMTAVPGTSQDSVSFGVTAAEALKAGKIDGFWANGMGAEVAVRSGVGKVIVDARRSSGPWGWERYTFASLMTSETLEEKDPEIIRRVVAGLTDAQRRLRERPSLATEVADGLFPAMETSLIAELIARDAPFYEATIRPSDIEHLTKFANARGLISTAPAFDAVVSAHGRDLWSGAMGRSQ